MQPVRDMCLTRICLVDVTIDVSRLYGPELDMWHAKADDTLCPGMMQMVRVLRPGVEHWRVAGESFLDAIYAVDSGIAGWAVTLLGLIGRWGKFTPLDLSS